MVKKIINVICTTSILSMSAYCMVKYLHGQSNLYFWLSFTTFIIAVLDVLIEMYSEMSKNTIEMLTNMNKEILKDNTNLFKSVYDLQLLALKVNELELNEVEIKEEIVKILKWVKEGENEKGI